MRGLGGARMEFIAVGGDDQSVVRMRIERDESEAHGYGAGVACPRAMR